MASVFQEIGVRAVVKDLAKYNQQLDSLDDKTRKTGKGLGTALTAGATVGVVAIGGIGVASLKLAADFETTMSRITGLTQTPADAVGGLRDQILALSKDLGVSANELGQGAYFILSSGITDTATAMEVLRLSAKAAAAGLGDTQTVANALTGVMNAYQLSASDAASVTDQLIGIVKAGKVEPAELADTLQFTVPIAAQMGIEFDQVGAVLATLTNQNLKAGQAGEYLRGVFKAILAPTEGAQKAFAGLGIPIEDFQDMVRTDFVGSMQLLVDKAGAAGVDLVELFPNVEGLTAVLAAFAGQGDQTAANLDLIRNSTGALDQAFGAVQNTAAFKFKKAMNSVQTSLIALGAKALPSVAKGLDALVPVLDKQLPKGVKITTKVFGAFGKQILFVVNAGKALVLGGTAIIGFFTDVTDAILGTTRAGIRFVDDAVQPATRALDGLLEPLRPVKQLFADLLSPVKGLFQPLKDFASGVTAADVGAQGAALTIGAFLTALVVSKVTDFLGPLRDLVGTLGQLGGKVFSFAVKQTGGAAVGAAGEAAGEAAGSVVPFMTVNEMLVKHMTVESVTAPPTTGEGPDVTGKLTLDDDQVEKAGLSAAGKFAGGFVSGLGVALGASVLGAALIGAPIALAGTFVEAFTLALITLLPALLLPVAVAIVAGLAFNFRKQIGQAFSSVGSTIIKAIVSGITPANVGKAAGTGLAVLATALFPPLLIVKFRDQLASIIGLAFRGVADVLGTEIPGTGVKIGEAIIGSLATLPGAVYLFFKKDVASVIGRFFSQDLPTILSGAGPAIQNFVSVDLPRFFVGLPDAIVKAIGDIPGLAKAVLVDLPAVVEEQLGLVVGKVGEFGGKLVVFFAGLGVEVLKQVLIFLASVEEAFLGFFGINSLAVNLWIADVVSAVGGIVGKIAAFAGDLFSAGFQLGDAIIGGFRAAFGSGSDIAQLVANVATEALNGMIGGINKLIPNNIGKVSVNTPLGSFEIFPGLDLPDDPIKSFAKGTPFVPDDMLALLHRGEMVVPRALAAALRGGNSHEMVNSAQSPAAMNVLVNAPVSVSVQSPGWPEIIQAVHAAVNESLNVSRSRSSLAGATVSGGIG